MHTIHCPTCKRVLHAPDESGDHRVTCPGCNVAFAVVVEDGVVRVLSTSISTEVPSEKPTLRMEVEEPPGLLPALNSSVYEDEGSYRARRIHTLFVYSFLGSFAFFGYMILSDRGAPAGWLEFLVFLPATLFMACLFGGFFSLLVGNIVSYKAETHMRGDRALRRMWEALEVDDPSLEEEPTSTSGPIDRFPNPSDVPLKDSPA